MTAFVEAKRSVYAKPPEILARLPKRTIFTPDTAPERLAKQLKYPISTSKRTNRDIVSTKKRASGRLEVQQQQQKRDLQQSLQQLIDMYAPIYTGSKPAQEEKISIIQAAEPEPRRSVPSPVPRQTLAEALALHEQLSLETEQALQRATRALQPESSPVRIIRADSPKSERQYSIAVEVDDGGVEDDEDYEEDQEIGPQESSFNQYTWIA